MSITKLLCACCCMLYVWRIIGLQSIACHTHTNSLSLWILFSFFHLWKLLVVTWFSSSLLMHSKTKWNQPCHALMDFKWIAQAFFILFFHNHENKNMSYVTLTSWNPVLIMSNEFSTFKFKFKFQIEHVEKLSYWFITFQFCFMKLLKLIEKILPFVAD